MFKKPLSATIFVIIVALSLLHACGGGSSSSNPTNAQPGPTDNPTVTPPTDDDTGNASTTPAADALKVQIQNLGFEDLVDISYQAILLRSPESVIGLGLHDTLQLDHYALDDLSSAYQKDTFAMHAVTLEALLAIDRNALNANDQINYDVYQWYLEDMLERERFMYYDFKSTYLLFGSHNRTLRFLTETHPLANEQDARDLLQRMRGIRRKFTQLSDHLADQRDIAQVIEPLPTLQIAASQVSSIANAAVNFHPYFISFRDRLTNLNAVDQATKDELLEDAAQVVSTYVIPAYRILSQTMQDLIAQAPASPGVNQYDQGAEYYAYALRHHTTTELDADQIHELGVAELRRVTDQLQLLFDELSYPQNEGLEQLFARVANDGGTITANDALATYEALIDQTYDRMDSAFHQLPQARVVVIPDANGGGYYIGPSIDGSRPGAFYAGTNTQPFYSMPSLTYHEALPGHHLQIALAREQDVPLFRQILSFTGFVEGWALYAERLATELGWYDDDIYGEIGRLQYEALRAARLVIDTGIHARGWSIGTGATFNRENVGWSSGASQNAALRYSAWPGQATAYLVGMLTILEQRERAQSALGAQFDLRDFHDAILSHGSIPLTLLPNVIDQYIDTAQNNNN